MGKTITSLKDIWWMSIVNFSLVQVLFIGLKVLGAVSWSWWLVFAPSIAVGVGALIIICFVLWIAFGVGWRG